MRNAFVATLRDLALADPRIVLMTADLGYRVVEPFAERLPQRFINVGVAEHNLVGIATGLAEAGYLPFLYSIASFMALRPYEAIRNGPLFHRLPVRLIAVGGGTDYGQQGLTHYALEDISIMRVQPELMVIAPADSRQAQAALTATWNAPGPIYYRLGKDEAPDLPNLDGRFDPDGVEFVRQGDDVLFLATGPISREALAAADMLSLDGIEASVGVVAALNPAPGALAPLVRRFRAIVTAEAHYVVGGLGSLVSETVADQGAATRVLRAGFTRMPQSTTGSREHLYREHGLNREALRDLALTALERPVPNR